MRRTRRSMLGLGAAAVAAAALGARRARASADETVRESVYNYVIVAREGPVVSFRRLENGAAISAIDLSRPSYQVVPYTKYLFAPALVAPDPKQVLSIGLGAGAFNRLFALAWPEATLTSVEIDPMIRDLAVEFTQFEEGARNRVVIEDGRRFLRRSGARWDWIVIDAFVRNSQYPPHLATAEFFALVADHLTEGGLLVINVISGNRLFDCLVATIAAGFAGCVVFAAPGTANVVVLASAGARGLLEAVRAGAPPAWPLLEAGNVDLSRLRLAAAAPGPLACARTLTDDFSPTEFLGAQWAK
ncbi:MAG: fused MFS/spermidine synthase [Roseiarcus sp.]